MTDAVPMTMTQALTAMGYRRVPGNDKKWLKAIAFQGLTWEEDRRELTLWFKSYSDDKLMRWNTQAYKEDSTLTPLQFLMDAEATLTGLWRGDHQFHDTFVFLRTDELVAELL